MERSLQIELLRTALGEHAGLPSPEELQNLLAQTEISLFTGGGQINESLLAAGWYLHSIASVRPDFHMYEVSRQRRAHEVSAHIFDVFIRTTPPSDFSEYLRFVLAAQIGYVGAQITPNAAAMASAVEFEPGQIGIHPGLATLQAGMLILALDRRRLRRLLPLWLQELAQLRLTAGDGDNSFFAACDGAITGISSLLSFLTTGREDPIRAGGGSVQKRAGGLWKPC
jgi:hypothetical protein